MRSTRAKSCLILGLLLCFRGVSGEKCPNWLRSENAPLCPEGEGGPLDNSYPVRAHVMSTASWPWADPPEVEPLVKMLFEVLKQKPESPPFLFLIASEFRVSQLKEKLAEYLETPEALGFKQYREKWLQMIKQIPESSESEWVQDYIEQKTDYRSGKTKFHFLRDYYFRGMPPGSKIERTTFLDRYIQDFARTIESSIGDCGVERGEDLQTLTEGVREAIEGRFGGNIQPLFGSFCLSGAQMPAQIKQALCGEGKVVEIDTGFLKVGHADEIMNLLPYFSAAAGECPFVLQYASLEKAYELLKRSPEERFYGNSKAFGPSTVERDEEKMLSSLCEFVMEFELSQGRLPIWKRPSSQLKTHAAPISGEYRGCNPYLMSNGEVLRALEGSEIQRKRLIQVNAILQKNLKAVESVLEQKLSCRLKKVAMPYLFYTNTPQGESRMISYFPSPTNGVTINGAYVYGDQPNPSFATYIQDTHKRLKIKTEAISAWKMHQAHGSLHCASQTIRYCRPRNLKSK